MEYTKNYYRIKKFKDEFFLTTDHGSFCILNEKELLDLNQNKKNLEPNLFQKLERSEIIITKNNINEIISLTRKRNNFMNFGPSLFIIVLTRRCDMNCIYCQASSKISKEKSYDMNEKNAKKIVDFIFKSNSNTLTIEFQGGEPLLNWKILKFITNYSKIVNKSFKKKIHLSIVTNLNNMDEEKLQFIINNNINICTSFDGPQKIHDYNRPYTEDSNYKKVVYWIKKINEKYKELNIYNKNVNALITLTNKSLKFPEEIINEYIELDLKIIHLRFLNRLGFAQNSWGKIKYTPEEFITFWIKAVNYIIKKRKEGIIISERMVDIIYNKITKQYDPNYLDLRSPCGAVIGQLAFDFDGNIYVCDEARMIGEDIFNIGNVNKKNNDLKNVVTCEKSLATINASINDQYMCNECVYKPYCGVCPVCNYANQGNLIGKISETDRCKIYKAQFDWFVKNIILNKREDKI
jgi:uncharacterized protein